jgi:hypothetical protein
MCGVAEVSGMIHQESDGSYQISINIPAKSLVFDLKENDDGSYRPRFTWNDNGPEATFEEYCEFNPYDLPTTKQELDDLYSSYLSIVNAGNDPLDSYFFFEHSGKIATEIDFACFEKRLLPTAFKPKIQKFADLIFAHADDNFRNYLISQMNVSFAMSIGVLEYCCEKCNDPFYVSCLAAYEKLAVIKQIY